jgi:hypothetical protein
LTASPLGRDDGPVLRAAVLLALFVGLVTAVAGARAGESGRPGTWELVSTPVQSPISVIGLARTSDGVLHVAWQRELSSGGALMQTPISSGGSLGSATTIVSGWSAVGDAALVAEPGGGLRVFFSGIHSTSVGEPLFGLNTATAPASGAQWALKPASIVTADFAYGRTPAVALAADGTPLESWYSGSTIVVHRGLDPATPDNEYPLPQATSTQPNLATDVQSKRMYVAWCDFGPSAGTWVEEVNTSTGAPAGPAHKLPGSTTVSQGQEHSTCNLSSAAGRTPIAARPGGGVFVAGAAGYPTQTSVLLWRLNPDGSAGAPITVASSAAQHSHVALAAGPDGRVWVAWSEEGGGAQPRIAGRRSDSSGTSFTDELRVAPPASTVQVNELDLAAQANVADLLARATSSASNVALWHTQVTPTGVAPIAGAAIVAATAAGTVLVRRPGSNQFVQLSGAQQLPVGSEIDTTRGRIHVTSAAGTGKTQTADFYEGRFVIGQTKRSPLTTLRLSARLSCGKSRKVGAAGASPVKIRRLWGNGKGQFRTVGHFASATVRGTIWVTQDTCAGTLVRVVRGRVDVFDNVKKRHFLLGPGQTHFAARR